MVKFVFNSVSISQGIDIKLLSNVVFDFVFAGIYLAMEFIVFGS